MKAIPSGRWFIERNTSDESLTICAWRTGKIGDGASFVTIAELPAHLGEPAELMERAIFIVENCQPK